MFMRPPCCSSHLRSIAWRIRCECLGLHCSCLDSCLFLAQKQLLYTYVILQVLLSLLEGRRTKLGGDLGGGIVQEVAVLSEHVPVGSSTLLRLIRVAIVLRLRLRLGGRRG